MTVSRNELTRNTMWLNRTKDAYKEGVALTDQEKFDEGLGDWDAPALVPCGVVEKFKEIEEDKKNSSPERQDSMFTQQ